LRPQEQAGFHIWQVGPRPAVGDPERLKEVPDDQLVDEAKKLADAKRNPAPLQVAKQIESATINYPLFVGILPEPIRRRSFRYSALDCLPLIVWEFVATGLDQAMHLDA
jgi:hypothetical protein